MKTLLIAINSKYIHPGYGAYHIYTNAQVQPILKEFTINDDIDNIINFILNSNVDMLAFSCYIWNIQLIQNILSTLQKQNYQTPILLGGPEVSYNAKFYFENFDIEFIIKNEGEEAYNELISYLLNERTIESVSNLYYFKNNQIHYTFDKLPNLKHIKSSHHLVDDLENKIIYFESSRGCCFKCSYCMASLEDGIRLFPSEIVKQELKLLLDTNVRTIKFLDRSFNIYVDYALEIIKFLIEHDNNYTTIQFEVVADVLDDKIIDYILDNVRPGYFRFEIGIQSTNEKTLKAVRRTQNFKKLSQNIKKLQTKVVLHLDLIAGLPYENKESFIDSFNETFLLFGHELQLGFLKELSGTLISLEKMIHGYTFDSQAPYEVVSNKYISQNDLDEIRIVEQMVNRLYNNSLMNKTIKYLVTENIFTPYELFLRIGQYFIDNNINYIRYQIHDLFIGVYRLIKTIPQLNHDYILFLLKQDYLLRFNIRPKIWWDYSLTKAQRFAAFEKLATIDKNLNLDTLYRYCRIEKYKDQVFAILYLPNEKLHFTFTLS